MRTVARSLVVLALALATAAFAAAPPKSVTARTCGRCPTGEYCCQYHGGLCLPNGFPCP